MKNGVKWNETEFSQKIICLSDSLFFPGVRTNMGPAARTGHHWKQSVTVFALSGNCSLCAGQMPAKGSPSARTAANIGTPHTLHLTVWDHPLSGQDADWTMVSPCVTTAFSAYKAVLTYAAQNTAPSSPQRLPQAV